MFYARFKKLPSFRSINSVRRSKSDIVEKTETESSFVSRVDAEDDFIAREREIDNKRNKSRLNPNHYNLLHGVKPYEQSMHWAHNTVRYTRGIWGKFGQASGIDPVICWPTKEELKEKIEYERIAYPFTIQEMIKVTKHLREEKLKKMYARDAEVAKKIAKVEEWKTDIKLRMEKRLNEAIVAKEKKERLIEEVRRHFGFEVSPKDERFQELLLKKEKEQKKAEKEAKKAAREAKFIAKLQQKNLEVSQATAQAEKKD